VEVDKEMKVSRVLGRIEYQFATARLHAGGKSILIPATPAFTAFRKNSFRASGFLTSLL
jgi:hypothetical protein